MPKEAYGIGIFLAGIAAGLLLAAYAGPYRLVADLQIALFSTNIVVISFFVTMLVIAAPIMGLLYALERRFGTRETLVPLSVRDLENGRPPAGDYVDLSDGTLLENTSSTFRDRSSTYRYIPVVDHAAQPVLFLRVSERQAPRDRQNKITGILALNGMEGELESQLQSAHAIGEKYYVLGVGRVPDTSVGGWIGLIGAGMSLIGLIWWRERYPAVRRKVEGDIELEKD